MTNSRNIDVDALKGLAILAVVFYHIGILDSGYLGVDIFFVINGFLVIPKLCEYIDKGEFKYGFFVKKKYLRFAPLVLLATLLGFTLGYFVFLPNQFKVLSESAFASTLFLQNVFATFTSGNYWDVQASYSPLVHFWYIGVLFQFYLIFPVLLIILKQIARVSKKYESTIFVVMFCLIMTGSLIINFTNQNETVKFYGLPFRLYEFCLGGVTALVYKNKVNNRKHLLTYLPLLFLLFSLCSCFIFHKDINEVASLEAGFDTLGQSNLIPREYLTIFACFGTCLAILFGVNIHIGKKALVYIGSMSYSIYVWHYLILAYTRCVFTNKFTFIQILCLCIVIFLVALFSNRYLEREINNSTNKMTLCILLSILILSSSFFVYKKNGVLRNYPEMGITVENAHDGMYSEYCDRVKKLDLDFPDNEKNNVLILGNSFARDFANVILESQYRDSINLSYCPHISQIGHRVEDADVICYHGFKEDLDILPLKNDVRLFGIGTKNYGESISIIYSKRFKDNYYSTRVPIIETIARQEERLKASWGDSYYSFLDYVIDDSNQVQVFADNNRFISFDCRHLSQSGAIFYSSKFNLDKLLQ